MKKFALVLVIFLVVGSVWAYGREREATTTASDDAVVVAFGDSLVQGVGSTDGGFVEILSSDLNTPIINLGRSGDTTKLALGRIDEVTEVKPTVTILLLGGNDFLRGVPEVETEKNLEQIISALQASGSTVLLLGIESGIPGNRHRQIFETLARKYKTAYVPDILGGIYSNSKYMSDSLHPNDEGYEIMAEKIRPTLEVLMDK